MTLPVGRTARRQVVWEGKRQTRERAMHSTGATTWRRTEDGQGDTPSGRRNGAAAGHRVGDAAGLANAIAEEVLKDYLSRWALPSALDGPSQSGMSRCARFQARGDGPGTGWERAKGRASRARVPTDRMNCPNDQEVEWNVPPQLDNPDRVLDMGAGTAVAVWLLLAATVRAQGAGFDVGARPGSAGGASTVGQSSGAAHFADSDTASAPASGPRGSGRHARLVRRLVGSRRSHFPGVEHGRGRNPRLQPQPTTNYGELELPAGDLEYGRPDGMTPDIAIEMLIKQNLDVETGCRLEIPMSQADVLTASLRSNPDLLRGYPAHPVRPLLVPPAAADHLKAMSTSIIHWT